MTRRNVTIFFAASLLLAAACAGYFFWKNHGGGISLAGPYSAPDAATLEMLRKVGFTGPGDLSEWKMHKFNGASAYQIVKDSAGDAVLDVTSKGDSSLLLHEASFSLALRPHVSWSWRVLEFPSGKSNKEFAAKVDSDFGARMYVVFKGLTPFTSDTIQYVWDDHFPVGTWRASPAAKHVKLLVIRSGQKDADKWVRETRDIYKDYQMLFGRPPDDRLHAVGIMSDSDNTRSAAHGQFKDIQILVPKGTASVALPPAPSSPLFSISEYFLSLKKMGDAAVAPIPTIGGRFLGAVGRARDAVWNRLFPVRR